MGDDGRGRRTSGAPKCSLEWRGGIGAIFPGIPVMLTGCVESLSTLCCRGHLKKGLVERRPIGLHTRYRGGCARNVWSTLRLLLWEG
eukprot:5947237-Pleurochrysis_carterae.AAC.1